MSPSVGDKQDAVLVLVSPRSIRSGEGKTSGNIWAYFCVSGRITTKSMCREARRKECQEDLPQGWVRRAGVRLVPARA